MATALSTAGGWFTWHGRDQGYATGPMLVFGLLAIGFGAWAVWTAQEDRSTKILQGIPAWLWTEFGYVLCMGAVVLWLLPHVTFLAAWGVQLFGMGALALLFAGLRVWRAMRTKSRPEPGSRYAYAPVVSETFYTAFTSPKGLCWFWLSTWIVATGLIAIGLQVR